MASGINRLKNAGTAISAYEPEPIASSGAVGLACGFGWVDPYFQVGPPGGPMVVADELASSAACSCGRGVLCWHSICP